MLDPEAMQEAWSRTRDREARRASGQFFTPRWIASGMARWLLDVRPSHIVDPAFGFGILADECRRQGYEGHITAYEIDHELAAAWRAGVNGSSTVNLIEADFLANAPAAIEGAIANPPYNRFQNRDLVPAVQLHLHQLLGELASGYTNQYALFIYLVVSRLAANGRAAFIVPSEFLATGYGVQVKTFLLRSRRLRHLVLFDTAERVFADAATTACVLLFDAAGQADLNVWRLAGSTDHARFNAVCTDNPYATPDGVLSYEALDPKLNWQNLGQYTNDTGGLVPLARFGRAKRGIATGANEFFVLTREEAASRQLDESSLVPCIAGADSAMGPVFDNGDWQALQSGGRQAYLFDGAAQRMSSTSGGVELYIEYGERQGYHQRYLTKSRKPWYRLEQREVAPLLLAVFGRAGFRAVLNRSNAVNLTSFHAFYPLPEFRNFVGPLWLYLQTTLAHREFERQRRSYGDGLKKLEPGDWNKLLVPDWCQWSATSISHANQLVNDALNANRTGTVGEWTNAVEKFADLIGRRQPIADGTPRRLVVPEQLPLV